MELARGVAHDGLFRRLVDIAATLNDPLVQRETYLMQAGHWAECRNRTLALESFAQLNVSPETFQPEMLAGFSEFARPGVIRAQVELLKTMKDVRKVAPLVSLYRESTKDFRSAHHAHIARRLDGKASPSADLWLSIVASLES
jgi:hypothetical protein